jgi:L-rhamnose mutarotase
MKFPVQTIIFDQGLEYVNSVVQNLLKERGVHSYHILTKTKTSSAERVIKTIKHIIWKIFAHNKNNRWIDILEDLTINYNNTYHKSIKLKSRGRIEQKYLRHCIQKTIQS